MTVTQLVDALERFGAHDDDCEAHMKVSHVAVHRCTCGLWKAIDDAKKLASPPQMQYERLSLLAEYIALTVKVPERKKHIELILRGWYPPILFVEPDTVSRSR